MPLIEIHTLIKAPPERCFDLSRSIDLHADSVSHTGEQAVRGTCTGLIGMGESVTWRARHFGVWQYLTSKITAYDRPHMFVDEMQEGVFDSFTHHHLFKPHPEGTLMTDLFRYRSPLGLAGRLADILFLTQYMRTLLTTRNRAIMNIAESDRYMSYLL
ncbi:cell division protein [Roseivirga sp. BDSF3-8]|uniref:SRPBCC family protein n=1 Tax=Roseivirga sp. BDSF3-8 TaxID=3241598 RepID=UPI00353195B5